MENHRSDELLSDGLPKFTLRVSMRAKRLQLRVDHWGKVEVVVPRNVNIGYVVPFVRRHRKWLERTLAKIRVIDNESSATTTRLPDNVHLLSLGEVWDVSYQDSMRSRFRVTIKNDVRRCLEIEKIDGTAARSALQAWIRDYAQQRLLPWLHNVSEECQLPYQRAGVRAQKTRWGSCSADGHINLNRHLLFLPPHLVRYIMIHELCHTVYLNHSRRYWTLVYHFVPDFKVCESELMKAACHIPRWACPE